MELPGSTMVACSLIRSGGRGLGCGLGGGGGSDSGLRKSRDETLRRVVLEIVIVCEEVLILVFVVAA